MKKVILSAMVVGTLLATSCKNEKKDVNKEINKEITDTKKKVEESKKEVTDEVKKVADMVESALEGVKIPKFSNEAVTKNLQDYASYAKEYIAANGNVVKISAMATKGANLLKQGQELMSKLDANDVKKYTDVLSQIQTKMAPKK